MGQGIKVAKWISFWKVLWWKLINCGKVLFKMYVSINKVRTCPGFKCPLDQNSKDKKTAVYNLDKNALNHREPQWKSFIHSKASKISGTLAHSL